MIKTKPLEEIIKLCIYSDYVKNERPVSLLIVAKPESGKTEVLRLFKVNNGIAYITDITKFGLESILLPKIERGEIRRIIIPDFLKVLGRSKSARKNIITLLNALVEEGVVSIQTFLTHQEFKKEVKCGLITAITSFEFFRGLGGYGFLTRLLPFSYSYDLPTVNKIFKYLISEKYKEENPIKLKLPKRDKEIKLSPRLAEKLIPISSSIGQHLKIYGFRIQRHLQILAKASALERGSKKVTMKDINRIIKLSKWMNLKMMYL